MKTTCKIQLLGLHSKAMKKIICLFLLIWFVSLHMYSPFVVAGEGVPIKGKIVFYSNRHHGKLGLHLYDGNRVKFLAPEWGFSTWFKDGQRILVLAVDHAYIINLQGKVLETIETGISSLKPRLLFDESGFAFVGTKREMSRDGKVLSGIDNLYIYFFKDKSIVNITSFDEEGSIFGFDTSPVNDWIAFNWLKKIPIDPKTNKILNLELLKNKAYLLNLKTHEKRYIGEDFRNLQWTPDGKKLFYETSTKNGKIIERWSGLFSFDSETKTSTCIHEPFTSLGFRFSPDGKKIIYSNWYANGIYMFILDLETKKIDQVLPVKEINGEGINDNYPDWHE